MKKILLSIFLILVYCHVFSQYYLRGEIRDVKGNRLSDVKILLYSTGNFSYRSGSTGAFGIRTNVAIDTITLIFDGYETFKKVVETNKFQTLVLQMLPSNALSQKNKLSSITKNLTKEENSFFSAQGESYSNLIENSFLTTNLFPETGFALNIDKAAYSNIRRFLNNEIYPPKDAVRIEELLNYFSFNTAKKIAQNNLFNCNTYITDCPWNKKNKLLFVNLQAPKLNLDSVPPSNLVFLIDISGSMDKPNRLPLIQSAFKMLTDNLREKDTVAIVIYGGGVARILNPTSGAEKIKINSVIDSLVAAGDTPGEGAIQSAYNSARETFIKNGNNRVILATDGDFNVGQTSEKALEELIVQQRQYGIFLTCLGVGMGNYKDSKLESLAKKGNGNFAYLDNINEAQKVFVTEFTSTLYAVANDAMVKVKFNEDVVKQYRLIGFDNKKNSVEDSTSEIEGGEVGSGHAMMAIFEFMPSDDTTFTNHALGNIQLQFKNVKNNETMVQNFDIPYQATSFNNADSSLKFATAVCMFGSLLKQSKYATNYSFKEVYNIAMESANKTDLTQQEFLMLIKKANKIYFPQKKKKRNDDW